MTQRYITLFRKPAPNQLDWDFYISEDADEMRRVVANIADQGIHQYSTYSLGDRIVDRSSVY
jgi:hypothetical protein